MFINGNLTFILSGMKINWQEFAWTLDHGQKFYNTHQFKSLPIIFNSITQVVNRQDDCDVLIVIVFIQTTSSDSAPPWLLVLLLSLFVISLIPTFDPAPRLLHSFKIFTLG